MLNIDNKISSLHIGVAQAEVTFVDAIKIMRTMTKWCFLQTIVF